MSDGTGDDAARAGGAGDADAAESAALTEAADEQSEESPGDVAAPSVRGGDGRSREVVVPLALYKRVTTYATLVAVACVVAGFVLLDAATLQVSTVRNLVVAALGWLGVQPPSGVLSGVFAVFGLASILFGAAVYVLGSRFRAGGMGNAQEDTDEQSNNG
ncbi:DUF7315 family membrane protein [Halobaculum sp. P14]|uniref:DUF7315 family membrane protein n=1 Tax=Halobaculum sp. P14 TaxID=3421638 RepID=UPI003EB7959F